VRQNRAVPGVGHHNSADGVLPLIHTRGSQNNTPSSYRTSPIQPKPIIVARHEGEPVMTGEYDVVIKDAKPSNLKFSMEAVKGDYWNLHSLFHRFVLEIDSKPYVFSLINRDYQMNDLMFIYNHLKSVLEEDEDSDFSPNIFECDRNIKLNGSFLIDVNKVASQFKTPYIFEFKLDSKGSFTILRINVREDLKVLV
jgi:hypothetical protein